MIAVKVFYESNRITAFELSGHAESGPYGYDLVCAGVSAVSFGVVNAIDALCKIDLEIELANEGGYLHVSIPNDMNQELSDKVQLLLEGMIISLQTIEREYSQFIKIDSK